MAAVTYPVDRYIDGLLAGASIVALVGSRVYNELSPDNPTFPLVVYQNRQGIDTTGIGQGAKRILTRVEYQVKAITKADPNFSSAHSILAAIDEVLEAAASAIITIGGVQYAVGGFQRTDEIRYVERTSGIRYNHLGGIYTGVVSKA